ncbi:hypothetical protein LINPERHAP1_LOCUS41954 [Linum perenne]
MRLSMYYPGPVRRFYANIHHHRSTPGHFTTLVYGQLLTITLDLIGKALNLPTTSAGVELDYILHIFNAQQVLRLIALLAQSDGSTSKHVTSIMKYVGLDLDEFLDVNKFHPLQAQDILHVVHSRLALTKNHGSDQRGEMPNTHPSTRASARKRTFLHSFSRNLADKDFDPKTSEKGKTIVIDDSEDPNEEYEEVSGETSCVKKARSTFNGTSDDEYEEYDSQEDPEGYL